MWNKNNKACGDDLVINEYIKSTTEKFIELYEKLFNLIFQSGVIPDSWLNGNMKPIYKNKGCKTDSQTFNPITVLSFLGKVFTSILSERLTQYSGQISCIRWKPKWVSKRVFDLGQFIYSSLPFQYFKK